MRVLSSVFGRSVTFSSLSRLAMSMLLPLLVPTLSLVHCPHEKGFCDNHKAERTGGEYEMAHRIACKLAYILHVCSTEKETVTQDVKAYLKADEYLDLADPRGRELFGKTFEKTRKAIIDDGGGSLALCGDAEWDLFNASGYYGFPEYQEFMRTRQFLKDLPKRMTGTIHKLSNLGEEIWCMEQGKEEAPLEACEMETIPTLDHMPKGWCYATATTQHNMAYDMTCKLAFIVRRDMKAEVLVTEEMKGYVESNAYSDITDEKGLELFRTAFSGVRKALTVVGSTYTEAVLDILEICSHYGFPERDDLIGKNQSGMVRFYIAFDKLAGRGKSIWGCSSSGQITSR